MNFANLCGFRTSCFINKSFIKYYDNIAPEHWERITTATTVLSDNKLGPKIISIGKNYIEYKKVNELDDTMSPNEARKQIRELVGKLHDLGWGHGDLGIQNLGVYKNKIVMLDPDTMYNFANMTEPPQWLLTWMRDCRDLDKFIQQDFDTWNTDWLYTAN